MFESRAEASALGGETDIVSLVEVGLNFLQSKNLTAESHEQTYKCPSTVSHPILHKKLVPICADDIYFCDLTKIWSSGSESHNC